jgi:hypothetical protein
LPNFFPSSVGRRSSSSDSRLSGSGPSSMSASAPSDWPVSALVSEGRDAKLGVFRSSTFEVFEVDGAGLGSSTCFATWARISGVSFLN